MSGGGGQALVGKWGRVLDGGIDQIFANWGDLPVPSPREKTLPTHPPFMLQLCFLLVIHTRWGDFHFSSIHYFLAVSELGVGGAICRDSSYPT